MRVSRNAVIGKLHRLGVHTGRDPVLTDAQRQARRASAKRIRRWRNGVKPNIRTLAEAEAAGVTAAFTAVGPGEQDLSDLSDEQRAQTVTLLEHKSGQCLFPYGDPQKPDFRLCGLAALEGRPYCAPHARLCYQTVAERRAEKARAAA